MPDIDILNDFVSGRGKPRPLRGFVLWYFWIGNIEIQIIDFILTTIPKTGDRLFFQFCPVKELALFASPGFFPFFNTQYRMAFYALPS